MKKSIQNVGVQTVSTLGTTVHMAVIFTGNVVKATTDTIGDGIANAEGFLVNKIDNTRDKKEVASLRKEATDRSFFELGMNIKAKADKMQEFLDNSKLKMKKAVVRIEEAAGLLTPAEAEDSSLMFDLHHLREQRNQVQEDTTLDTKERNRQVNAINRKIGEKNKLLNQLPKATPAEAFESIPFPVQG